MNKMRSIVKLLLLVFLLIPVNAFALNNNVEMSVSSGYGDIDVAGGGSADSDSLEFGLVYTHYVQPLKSDDSPYGVREFLQHPSNFGVAYATYDWEAKESGDTIDYNVSQFAFGGMFYTSGKENATGLGLAYVSQDTDVDIVSGGVPVLTSESENKTPVLTVEQYVSPNTRIGLSYAMQDAETNDVSHDENVWALSLESLIDNIWLSGYYKTGKDDWPSGYSDDDITGFGVRVGAYPSQKLGLFFGYNTEEIDDGSSEIDITDLTVSGDYYLDEKIHFKGSIARHKEDDPTFAEIEETIITIGAGLYF